MPKNRPTSIARPIRCSPDAPRTSDTATASIDADVKPLGQVSYFTAEMDSAYGGDGMTFRWDFGDGTAFTNAYKSATAGHTYTKAGTYTVRVEATNALGTKAILMTDIRSGRF